jgi:hypothetical protein
MTWRPCGWSPRTGCSRPAAAAACSPTPTGDSWSDSPPGLFTGWLDVDSDGTALYAPHTSKGFVAPPRKKLLLVSNGLLAKYGLWQARRQGTADRLEQLAAEKGSLQGPN